MTNSGAQNTTSKDNTSTALATPLAIVGIGCLFPQSENKDTYWANIKGGVDSISDIPESHWRVADHYDPDPKRPDYTYGKRGGFLDPVEFNPLEFSIQPNILEAIDTSQLLGLIAAREALKDAGYDPKSEFARERVSVLLGVTGALEMVIPLGARLSHPAWRNALKGAGVPDDVAQDVVERIAESYVPWQENSFPGLLGNVVAGRISKQFDLGGTNSVIDAACGSSLSAVHMAAMELSCGRSDMVITGGVDTFNDIFMYTCFSKTPALSPSNIIRPFDSDSDGTLIGEGLGLVVLKRLEDAERDNDQIYAVIRGIGTASDGKIGAIYEPSAIGQKRTLCDAYQQAGVDPKTISLVEAHGTGTKVGDATEISALREVYGESDGTPWCALGSVKSQIGHTKAAAGSAGLIKTALALYSKVLPPTINVDQPQEVITTGNSPFYVNTTIRPWLPKAEHPRRAAVSAFGFGGSNFHCVLEEHKTEASSCDWSSAPQIIALSGDNKASLEQKLKQIPADVSAEKLRRFAAQSRADYDAAAPQRLLFVVESAKELATTVTNAMKLLTSDKAFASTPTGIYYGSQDQQGKLAVLFPGQGAQYPQMLVDLACHSPQFLQTLTTAHDTLDIDGGLNQLIYPHSVYSAADKSEAINKLQATQVAQPAIGTVSLAAWNYIKEFGINADAFAGHSYGELTALCAAGCYSCEDLFRLSQLRGQLMAGDGSDKGTMLAVSTSLEKIEQLLSDENLDLVLANRNTPSQGVLSGARAEIERAAVLCKERGLRCVPLDVAAAFHSKLVAAASAPFLTALNDVAIESAQIPVFANKTAAPYPDDNDAMRRLLAEQIASPVEFVQQIERMHAEGITTFVEVGPGARLTGMVGKILKGKEIQTLALDSSNGKRSGLNDLARFLMQLAAIGYPIALDNWDSDYAGKELRLPEPIAPRMTVSLSGANYRKKTAPRPDSKRELVDRNSLPKHATQPTPVTTPVAATPTTAVDASSLRALQDNMLVLQQMQEDTAKLHNQFLEGQAAAVQTMRSLMDHQMGVTTPTTTMVPSVANVVAAPTTPITTTTVTTAVPNVTTATATATAVSVDVSATLLEVVAEKTGYPQEMLELDMSLDADLGIDSIKRVEILSAIQEKLPELPALQPEQLGSLQTLRQIVEAMGSVAVAAPTSAPAIATAGADISTTLLEVVAEKTGYPQEMLELDMSLDADLGIDSIKRVEILSAIQEKLPELPALQPEQLGSLQTLRQIVEAMGSDKVASESTTTQPESSIESIPPTIKEKLHRQVMHLQKVDENRSPLALQKTAPIWVVDDCSPLSIDVVNQLNSRGFKAELVSPSHSVTPDKLTALIVLSPQFGTDSRFLSDAFLLVQRCGQALKKNGLTADSCLLTVSHLDGQCGFNRQSPIIDPLSGGLAGISKTAHYEWPEVHCKALDLGVDLEDHQHVEAIIEELLCGGPVEVAASKAGRMTLTLKQEDLTSADQTITLSPDNVVVISGGARGVTAEVAQAIAQKGAPTLLLLGRSELPDAEPEWLRSAKNEAEIKKSIMTNNGQPLTPRQLNDHCQRVLQNRELLENIQRLEATGSKVLYRSVDIRDEKAVSNILQQVREVGSICGLIHGAGVLADRTIEDKTIEQFELVYSTKIAGLQALLQATQADQLDFIALFSSSTARFGRTGQVDYAVANEVLNKSAQALARQRQDCRVVSINWGPWDGGMVTPALKKLFASEGIEVIGLQCGAEYLLKEITHKDNNVEIVILGGEGKPNPPQPTQAAEVSQEIESTHSTNLVYRLNINVNSMPFLEDHVINGMAVVPMAILVEWLGQGALHNQPGLIFHGFNNLRIRKGILLDHKSAVDVELRCGQVETKEGQLIVPMQLCNVDDTSVYTSADIILTSALPPQRPTMEPLVIDGGEVSSKEEIYSSGKLFHGQALQGLTHVIGNNVEGIIALSNVAPMPSKWMEAPLRNQWLADPQALDSSFQMMILWSFAQKKLGSLPSFIAEYRQYCEQFPVGSTRIQCRVTKVNNHSATANIDFIDGQSRQLIARLTGYECTMTEGLQQAFYDNKLHK